MKTAFKKITGVVLLICGIILCLFAMLALCVPMEANGERVYYPNVIMAIVFFAPALWLILFGRRIKKTLRFEEEHKQRIETQVAAEEEKIKLAKEKAKTECLEITNKYRQEIYDIEQTAIERRAEIEKEEVELSIRQDEIKRLRSELDAERSVIENMKDENRRLLEQRRKNANVALVDGMEGHEFEYFSAELLRDLEYDDVEVTKGSGDQGVDIIALKDGIKYAIQCKNYASKLGNSPIQEVCTGKMFYECDVAVVLTNSTFTPAAIELAAKVDVQIWDRDILQKMMYEAYT